MHTPSWFVENKVLVINAKTCGINKDGKEQYIVDIDTGNRSNSEIDDALAECCEAISSRDFSRDEVFYHDYIEMINKNIFVPKYYDYSALERINTLVTNESDFNIKSLGKLEYEKSIILFKGHGSPSSDQRIGTIPYIKVSDLRAGHVNINPTNMIPIELAKKFWKGDCSGMKAYDLISPERASKNIGEFCVLMPGQENSVFTKEIIGIRSNSELFDQFYLHWALSLKEVREQWDRIIFMQTNREDVGKRISEIKIPVPITREVADFYSSDFKTYYKSLESSRDNFVKSLKESSFNHYLYLSTDS